jgi:hypothetical protein
MLRVRPRGDDAPVLDVEVEAAVDADPARRLDGLHRFGSS